uniref:BREX system Lon protease-like protein BrxL n=1 Tax=Salmonella enterica TaxID=28901 RepID=UPI00398C7496
RSVRNESGDDSVSRARCPKERKACMVLACRIIESVAPLLKTAVLLCPYPAALIDTALFDRFHAYTPGWEIPTMRPAFFTNRFVLTPT